MYVCVCIYQGCAINRMRFLTRISSVKPVLWFCFQMERQWIHTAVVPPITEPALLTRCAQLVLKFNWDLRAMAEIFHWIINFFFFFYYCLHPEELTLQKFYSNLCYFLVLWNYKRIQISLSKCERNVKILLLFTKNVDMLSLAEK